MAKHGKVKNRIQLQLKMCAVTDDQLHLTSFVYCTLYYTGYARNAREELKKNLQKKCKCYSKQ